MAFQPGSRGGVVFVLSGYKYQKNKTAKETTYWRCWRDDCWAPIKTRRYHSINQEAVLLGGVPNHNHPPDSHIIEHDSFRQAAVDAVKNNPAQPIKRTYNEQALQAGDGALQAVPQFHCIESALKRAR